MPKLFVCETSSSFFSWDKTDRDRGGNHKLFCLPYQKDDRNNVSLSALAPHYSQVLQITFSLKQSQKIHEDTISRVGLFWFLLIYLFYFPKYKTQHLPGHLPPKELVNPQRSGYEWCNVLKMCTSNVVVQDQWKTQDVRWARPKIQMLLSEL